MTIDTICTLKYIQVVKMKIKLYMIKIYTIQGVEIQSVDNQDMLRCIGQCRSRHLKPALDSGIGQTGRLLS